MWLFSWHMCGHFCKYVSRNTTFEKQSRWNFEIHWLFKKKIQTDAPIPIRTETNPTKIWNAIIQMIIFGALPFAIVNSQGFRYLIKPYAEAFKRAGAFFSVNELNVQSEIDDRATHIKKQISNETKGKMICLLIDIASRFNRSILGINIAYWANGRINHRTINACIH